MRQSNVIFATLLFAFIVYITLRGQLPSYLALFSKGGEATKSDGASKVGALSEAYSQFG